MKLYNAQLSPFAARCRIQIYAKGLDVELINLPGALPPEEFGKLTPMRKVPTLVDGETIVPESEVICEYLEDTRPEPSLRPADPATRARVRVLSRIGDLYIMKPLAQLFGQINPKGRDQILVNHAVEEIKKGIGWLGFYLDGSAYAQGDRLSLADCSLMPILFFVEQIGPMFAQPDLLEAGPTVARYYKATKSDETVARVLAEVDQALRQMQGR